MRWDEMRWDCCNGKGKYGALWNLGGLKGNPIQMEFRHNRQTPIPTHVHKKSLRKAKDSWYESEESCHRIQSLTSYIQMYSRTIFCTIKLSIENKRLCCEQYFSEGFEDNETVGWFLFRKINLISLTSMWFQNVPFCSLILEQFLFLFYDHSFRCP